MRQEHSENNNSEIKNIPRNRNLLCRDIFALSYPLLFLLPNPQATRKNPERKNMISELADAVGKSRRFKSPKKF